MKLHFQQFNCVKYFHLKVNSTSFLPLTLAQIYQLILFGNIWLVGREGKVDYQGHHKHPNPTKLVT